MQASIPAEHLAGGERSSQASMGWIEEYRGHRAAKTPESGGSAEVRFNEAARQRWRKLGQELQADVNEFNARRQDASFAEEGENLYRVRNSVSGLELLLRADFDDCIVRYEFRAVNDRTAGVPEGGILSIRESPRGTAEFYSADERLTSEETRQVLLQPVLFPPQRAA